MLAISLWQPWASAIACGAKRIETRSRRVLKRGPIAIHAAKRFSRSQSASASDFAQLHGVAYPDPMPLGAVVAIAYLRDCRQMTTEWIREQTQQEIELGDWVTGRWGWILGNVRPLRTPYPLKGRQSLWTLSEDDASKIRELAGPPKAVEQDPRTTAQLVERLTQLVKVRGNYWEHNKQCKPLSTEGCICGLWELRRLRQALVQRHNQANTA